MLTDAELRALATATVLFPAGFTIKAERGAERRTCDKLAAVEGIDGGYVVSDEAAEAQRVLSARTAEQAQPN